MIMVWKDPAAFPAVNVIQSKGKRRKKKKIAIADALNLTGFAQ